VKRKSLKLWHNHNRLLHHNNTPTHTSLKINIVIVPNPVYSPYLKMKLKGQCFEAVSDIEKNLQAVLDSIKENDFHGAFDTWEK
jgi:hypothetical protein